MQLNGSAQRTLTDEELDQLDRQFCLAQHHDIQQDIADLLEESQTKRKAMGFALSMFKASWSDMYIVANCLVDPPQREKMYDLLRKRTAAMNEILLRQGLMTLSPEYDVDELLSGKHWEQH
jgi:hypothetical protein